MSRTILRLQNGISALCDLFTFDERSKRLKIKKLQIVNGAQTLGALRLADSGKASDALVSESSQPLNIQHGRQALPPH